MHYQKANNLLHKWVIVLKISVHAVIEKEPNVLLIRIRSLLMLKINVFCADTPKVFLEKTGGIWYDCNTS